MLYRRWSDGGDVAQGRRPCLESRGSQHRLPVVIGTWVGMCGCGVGGHGMAGVSSVSSVER